MTKPAPKDETKPQSVVFDDMTWPLPSEDIAWALRYGQPTRIQMYHAASVMHAYQQLLQHSQKRRNYICAKLAARND